MREILRPGTGLDFLLVIRASPRGTAPIAGQ